MCVEVEAHKGMIMGPQLVDGTSDLMTRFTGTEQERKANRYLLTTGRGSGRQRRAMGIIARKLILAIGKKTGGGG